MAQFAQFMDDRSHRVHAVMVDDLTVHRNRRYGEQAILSRLNSGRDADMPFGVLFLDIDRFKDVNDVYGHDIGDRLLRMVANTVSGSIRSRDLLVRWGGEEFVVVLADVADTATLGRIADKLRVLVEQSLLIEGNAAIGVTVSIGATIAAMEDSVAGLIRRCDRLMYASKRNGRNRVSVG
jgi:diguanylate cyclase (GGDEF)-like protein